MNRQAVIKAQNSCVVRLKIRSRKLSELGRRDKNLLTRVRNLMAKALTKLGAFIGSVLWGRRWYFRGGVQGGRKVGEICLERKIITETDF